MNRRLLLHLLALHAANAAAAPLAESLRSLSSPRVEVSSRAADLVMESLVVDLLGLLTLDWPKLYRWQATPESFTREDARALARAGIDVFHPAVAPREKDQRAAAEQWIRGWNHLISGHPCRLLRVDDITDLLRLPRLESLGVVLGFQNSTHFDSVEDVHHFFERGQRISGLTYNKANRLGSGCKVAKDGGLTPFGVDVVAAMNEVGMAIDLSHCGERTTLDAIEASSAPVLVSHSNCRALVPWQRRNKSDEIIRRLARRGGVMGITTVRAFVGGVSPSLDDWLDHFDHVAHLVGVEHVALGSDIDIDAVDTRGERLPYYLIRGLEPAARAYQLAEGLLRRGYSEKDVRGVLGENALRVLGSIWPQKIQGQSLRRDPFCPSLGEKMPESVEITGRDSPESSDAAK